MTTHRVSVGEPSQIGETRRLAAALATGLGFSTTAVGRVSIVATELATNILRYGSGGEVLLDRVEFAGNAFVQLIALDRGAGMADVEKCLVDGYSTSISSGTGLGAVMRQSAVFDIHSQVGRGTAVLSLVGDGGAHTPKSTDALVGGVAVALAGEVMCGDAWAIAERPHRTTILLADGLGHGPGAAQAAREAIGIFLDRSDDKPGDIATAINLGIRATRGAAIGVLALDLERSTADYCGIGNVDSSLSGVARKRMVCEPGTAGASARRIRTYSYPFENYELAVLNTDGISSKWSLEPYRGLAQCHPTLVSAVLYRDFARGTDDASVVVARLDPR